MSAQRWLPAAAWAATLYWLSSQPQLPELPVAFPGADKLLHAGAYALLALTCAFALRWPQGARAFLPALLATAYGLTDELHQRYVPGRSADLADLFADGGGALLAVALVAAMQARRKEAT